MDEILRLRATMHATAAEKGLLHADTLAASERLDEAIVEIQRRMRDAPALLLEG